MTPLFQHHPRLWRDFRYVYPVISRRSRGLSVGINLNPDKACNFDCVYCSVDRREPASVIGIDPELLRDELARMLDLVRTGRIWNEAPFDRTPEVLRRFNDIAFSGDGEPTAAAEFGESCRMVSETCDWLGLTPKLVVITNATLLDRPAVEQALAYLDQHRGEIWAKLDAGTEAWYQRVDRTKIPLGRVLANLRAAGQRRALVIQALFLRLGVERPSPAEISAWVGRLIELRAGGCRLDRVQVYTVARPPAEAFAQPLAPAEIDAIAAAARAAGFTAEAFYGPG